MAEEAWHPQAGEGREGKKIRNTAGGVKMVKIMAVYDEDALYARRLAEYVNRRETIPFTAMAFSNLERLKEYGDSHEIEILLVGETVKAAADEVKAGLKMVLCGGEFSIGKEEPSIYRFQSGEGILRDAIK